MDDLVLPLPVRSAPPGGSAPAGGPGPLTGAVQDVRGGGLLQRLETPVLVVERWLALVLPDTVNPFVNAGGVANTALLVALATGILLLPFYDTSVHSAHASVAAMGLAPWSLGLLRGLHRYSSDAAMLFVVVHAIRMLLARRFAGARWLSWVTGVVLLVLLWGEGWTGIWLLWDERAQLVAAATARQFDVLPLFSTPLSQSFLTDAGVSSLFFFVVFFIHVLAILPLAGLAWLHVARVARPRFLASWRLSLAVVAALLVLSMAVPADLAPPARLAALPHATVADAWYLWPLALTERLGPAAVWGLVVASLAALLSVPWTLGRLRPPAPALVDEASCNACTKCFQDCPYDAISMVPRTDGRNFPARAVVDPDLCIACGACAGSCDSSGVGVPWLTAPDARARLDAWVGEGLARGEGPYILFGCAESAARALAVDEATGRCAELPGWRVLGLPCAAWLHPLTLERVVRRGARGVLVAACPEGSCRHREGATWTKLRLSGEREPTLRPERVPASLLRLVHLSATSARDLLSAARDFERGRPARSRATGAPLLAGRIAASLGIATLSAALLAAGSRVALSFPREAGSTLVVALDHAGQVITRCRDLTPEEKARLPAHMRLDQECERERSPVRLRAEVDGVVVLSVTHAPGGLWSDGRSVGIDSVAVAPGRHLVRVAVADADEAAGWTHVEEHQLEFTAGERRVVAFGGPDGFVWP